jgi:hypothetical protein
MGRAKGFAEIHFGMGCEQKRGDRNKFRSTGRRGAVAEMGRAKGFAEIYFGMGCWRKWGERKGSPKFISAWVAGGNGVTEINFGQRAGVGRGRRWATERVRRNLFRHGVGVEMGRPKGFAEIYFGMGCGRKWGDRKGSPKFISA